MNRHEEVLVALRRIIRAVDLQSRKLIQTTGLSGPQLVVMQAILRGGCISAGQLAREVSLSQGTVTAILDRLENRGLLARSRSQEDKRRVMVELSETGRAALAQAPMPLQEHFVQAFRNLQDWEQTQILSSLQRLALMMDAEHLDASPYLDTRPIDETTRV